MPYSKQSGFSIHRNCVNFRNGLCTLIGAPVDPNGYACPNFTPKSLAEMPQAAKAYTGTMQPYEPRLPQTGYGLPIPYAYPPWVGHGQGYSTMQDVGFLFMSSGRRGRGGGGGRGRGRMGGFAAGPGGSCVCPRCGYSISHVIGTPCYQQTCPKCGSRMTRGS
jgi:hypothetical protein